jgi:hypothetical protein
MRAGCWAGFIFGRIRGKEQSELSLKDNRGHPARPNLCTMGAFFREFPKCTQLFLTGLPDFVCLPR